MKGLIFLIMSILTISLISAVDVTPHQTIQLPQLTANHTTDNSGVERTYLYCSWHIGNIGEEAILMNSTLCPATKPLFNFEDSQTYSVRIDYAKISYTNLSGWVIQKIGKDGEMIVNYNMSVPEPSSSLFSIIFDNIRTTIRGWLCQFFPGLSFC